MTEGVVTALRLRDTDVDFVIEREPVGEVEPDNEDDCAIADPLRNKAKSMSSRERDAELVRYRTCTGVIFLLISREDPLLASSKKVATSLLHRPALLRDQQQMRQFFPGSHTKF